MDDIKIKLIAKDEYNIKIEVDGLNQESKMSELFESMSVVCLGLLETCEEMVVPKPNKLIMHYDSGANFFVIDIQLASGISKEKVLDLHKWLAVLISNVTANHNQSVEH